MSYELRIEDNIAIFTFKYGKVNAVTTETLKGLSEIVDRVNQEEELKGIILTGDGRYFSGGFDLETFTTFADGQAIIDWFNFEEEVLLKVFTCKKPVVAAINGHATAAGMILSMGCDYRIVVNHPKIKLGMTEIKIGLALTPAEAELMRFGLDTDKNYRDIIFRGELINPEYAIAHDVCDELAADVDELMAKAKAKVCALIDTPGRPFINLKLLQKQHAADWIREGIARYDFNELVKTFTDPEIIATLNFVKESLK